MHGMGAIRPTGLSKNPKTTAFIVMENKNLYSYKKAGFLLLWFPYVNSTL